MDANRDGSFDATDPAFASVQVWRDLNQDGTTEAGELGVEDRVRFVDQIPKVAVGEHLSSADVFLNTTNVDNAPVSVLEALACGLCVVSMSIGIAGGPQISPSRTIRS